MLSNPGVSVRKEKADSIISFLLHHNILEKNLKIRQDGDTVYIPIKSEAGSSILNIKTGRYQFSKRINGRNPYNEIISELKNSGINPESVPHKWIVYGDSVILRLSGSMKNKKKIGEAFIKATGCSSVYGIMGGVKNRDRVPAISLIAGKGGEIHHLENGVIYIFDPEKVMFSPGNVNERHNFLNLIRDGEKVLDMFAGIGYFSLQIARHTKASSVHCVDINPLSLEYLRKSAIWNRLDQIIETHLGDCRITVPDIRADIILMGNFSSIEYIAHGIMRLKNNGRIIVHFLVSTEEIETCSEHIISKIRRLGVRCSVEGLHRVKSYAPNLWHISAYLRIMKYTGQGSDVEAG
ncbi:class I SAM-dependent methyltransferase family protein [Oxyplasma meridianum]|uniref:Class I SAM-dependent methyltransferase family protein n=1 Tax=Oxyplasma meridianum TaxID=3073602 RepID=A0AAX4NE28_9ARCH